ncbi:50S ribosomal protein L15 [Candidatus Kaiserbacteria bacterium CG10_big_fil_rev_8_21_14_0_10_56_12]|uniref:Large ribosomal subunit protein uL15 n=1 Tax=Candidatus Kaiserbacteria bacterium CG10_big_fil_rev_8_21_14_0_10_56_12 TaxID=1974611 RepID=A0A2H0UBI9_9BACT|nr:MAG: 50S ribosomal protein L15 [Candidatus Kaiserbacteria bacterium CG10_big_fil_rev_8_21_14_0_10_56_12]
MQLHTLTSATKRHIPEPVGRGGKRGKTSGRGGKGQTARAGHKIRPEVRDQIKKIPKRRGHGKNRAHTVRSERLVYAGVNLATLEAHYKAGETVSPASLLAKGLVRRTKGRVPKVKILGTGTLSQKLVVKNCTLSASARVALGLKENA